MTPPTTPALKYPDSAFVGRVIEGKYRITRVLGVGGMGVVCEARHLELDKRVAIKITGRHGTASGDAAARFRREARATSAVESEHIVDVFDVGVDDTLGVYMVMELLQGEDLGARLEREGKLDVATAVRLGHQLTRGLGKAHAARIVHRDIKPGNVFLAKRDDGAMLVKLLDFGVSMHLDAHPGDSWDGSTVARQGGGCGPVGTPLYMSPEQAEGAPEIDARSDMWSLGAVLFEALAGRPPHEDRGAFHANLVAILQDDPPKLATVAPWVPAKLARVVDDLLVRDPAGRIRDCATLAARLAAAAPFVAPDAVDPRAAIIVASGARASEIPPELPSDPTLIAPSAKVLAASPARPREAAAAPVMPARTLEIEAMSAAQAQSILLSAHAIDSRASAPAFAAARASAPAFAAAPCSPSSTGAVEIPAPRDSASASQSYVAARPASSTETAPPVARSASPSGAFAASAGHLVAATTTVRRPWPLVAFAFGVAAVAAFVSAMAISHVRGHEVAHHAPASSAAPSAVDVLPPPAHDVAPRADAVPVAAAATTATVAASASVAPAVSAAPSASAAPVADPRPDLTATPY